MRIERPDRTGRAPTGATKTEPISRKAAQDLTYYESAQGLGVLAPRGWNCFGIFGSGGDALFVAPHRIDSGDSFQTGSGGFDGPAIEISHRFGYAIGRFDVAEV